jgi:hypothetical protein
VDVQRLLQELDQLAALRQRIRQLEVKICRADEAECRAIAQELGELKAELAALCVKAPTERS